MSKSQDYRDIEQMKKYGEELKRQKATIFETLIWSRIGKRLKKDKKPNYADFDQKMQIFKFVNEDFKPKEQKNDTL